MRTIGLLFLILYTVSCQVETEQSFTEEQEEGGTSIAIDPNVQLFRIAYNLAIADSIDVGYQPCNNTFYQETKNKYSKYANLPLVEKIRTGDEWNADLAVIALCYDTNFDLLPNVDTTDFGKQFGWYGRNLDSLAVLLKDFKTKTNYTPSDRVDFKSFTDSLKANKITHKLNVFFRQDRLPKLNILFDPQNNITNKAITFLKETDDVRGFLVGYFCDHPDSTTQNIELKWDEDYRRIVFHENAHLYTNELLDKYYDDVLDSLTQQTKFAEVYTDIDEIIVRGITAKILQLNYGEKIGEEEIAGQPKQSRIIYDLLEEYQQDESMTFEAIYQKIMEELKLEFR